MANVTQKRLAGGMPHAADVLIQGSQQDERTCPDGKGDPVMNGMKWVVIWLPLAWLWFRLLDNLGPEWSADPQYSYGLVVPVLVVGLLARRWFDFKNDLQNPSIANPWSGVWFCGLLAFLFLPTRLLEAATPEWRPLQWLMGFEVIGITLYFIYLAGGKGCLWRAAFPVAFFLVAIPWPTPIEQPIIQGLSRMNAALVVEVLGVVGVPAVQHGNIIEVSTGMVGINDACSGIRSLQSSLMISLFFGEFYFLRWPFRLMFVGLGFLLAMAFNLSRASLLAWIAAKSGVAAIAQYHDEAGFTILVACTLTLWGLGFFLSRCKDQRLPSGVAEAGVTRQPVNHGHTDRILRGVATSLIIWLVLVETGVELWYRIRESQIKPGPTWTVNLPESNATFRKTPLTQEELELLRFDEARQGQWQEPDGTSWQVFYFDWRPGRVAGYLAKRHTPEVCLTASGLKMTAGPKLEIMNVHGVVLPIRCYTFESSSGLLQVFQCRWETGEARESFTTEDLTRFNLIRGIWAGRGNQGQKVLEVIITGCDNPDQALQKLKSRLDDLIQVD